MSLRHAYFMCGSVLAIGLCSCTASLPEIQERELAAGTIQIEDGAPLVNRLDVLVTVGHPSANEMKLSNSLDCGGGQWQPYSAEPQSWHLDLAGDGVSNTVSVTFRVGDKESPCASASIRVDTVPPLQAMFLAPDHVNSTSVPITLSALNAARAEVRESGYLEVLRVTFDGGSTQVHTTLTLGAARDGKHTLLALICDAAENCTEAISAEVFLDRSTPSGTFAFAQSPTVRDYDGTTFTRTPTVRLELAASAASEMGFFETGDCTAAHWYPLAPSFDFTFAAHDDGPKQIGLCLRNQAGTTFGPVTRAITLDQEAPHCLVSLVDSDGNSDRTNDLILTAEIMVENPDDTRSIELSNYPSMSNAVEVAGWTPISAPPTTMTSSWQLLAGDGTKTVFATCADAAGNVSEIAWVRIELDLTPPATPTILVNYVEGGSLATNLRHVELTFVADSSAVSYELMRKIDKEDASLVLLGQGPLQTGLGTVTQYIDADDVTPGRLRSYQVYVFDRVGNRSNPSTVATAQVVAPVTQLATTTPHGRRLYTWELPDGSPSVQAFYRYTDKTGRNFNNPQPINSTYWPLRPEDDSITDWIWNEELAIVVSNYDGSLIQESHFYFNHNRLIRLDENSGAVNGTLALDRDGRAHVAYVETRWTSDLAYATVDGFTIDRVRVANDVSSELNMVQEDTGDVHLVYTYNSSGRGVTYARRTAGSSTWRESCLSCFTGGRGSYSAPNLAVDEAGHPHIMYALAGDYQGGAQYFTTVGDSQTEFMVMESPIDEYPGVTYHTLRTGRPGMIIDHGLVRAAFFTTDWGGGQNYFVSLAKDVEDTTWDTVFPMNPTSEMNAQGHFAAQSELVTTRAGYVRLYTLARTPFPTAPPVDYWYMALDATSFDASGQGNWHVHNLGKVPVSSYPPGYDFYNAFNTTVSYDRNLDTTVMMDYGRFTVLDGSSFVATKTLFSGGLGRASRMIHSADGRFHGLQATAHGELYYFTVEDNEVLPHTSSVESNTMVRQLAAPPTALTIPHSLALDAREQPAITYYDETTQQLIYATPRADGWSLEVIDSYSITTGSGRDSCWSINDYVACNICRHYDTSQPRLAFGPDGNPQVVYERFTDAEVWYAVRKEGQWQKRMLAVGTSPALAVDKENRAHIVYLGDELHVDPSFNIGAGCYNPDPSSLNRFAHIYPGADPEYMMGTLDSMTETPVPLYAPWPIASAANPAIAVDSAGQPHIAYSVYEVNWRGGSGAVYTHLQNGQFTQPRALGGGGFWPAIAVNSKDEVYISAFDTGARIALVRVTSDIWSRWNVGDDAMRRVNWSALAFDPTGGVVVNALNFDAKSIFLAFYDYGWQVFDLVSFSTPFVAVMYAEGGPEQNHFGTTHDLKIDSLGRPHITYFDYETSSLHYLVRFEPFRGVIPATSIKVNSTFQ